MAEGQFVPYTETGKRSRKSQKASINPEIESLFDALREQIVAATEDAGYKKKYEDLQKEHAKLVKKFNRLKKIIDVSEKEDDEA